MIRVETALPDDAKRIAEVHRLSWHETYDGIIPREMIENMLRGGEAQQIRHFEDTALGKKPEHMLLVARNEQDEIIGFCDALDQGELGELRALYILKEYQGRGIGSKFMEKVFQYLANCDEIVIDLLRENIPAIRFFENKGFALTGNSESFSGIIIVSLVRRKKK